jgi:heterodisulfide reductase subunit B
MPIFEGIEIDIEFEVICATCNKGLCSESDTRKSMKRNMKRNMLQVIVNSCPTCMANKDREIEDLKSQLDDLIKELSEV